VRRRRRTVQGVSAIANSPSGVMPPAADQLAPVARPRMNSRPRVSAPQQADRQGAGVRAQAHPAHADPG
jgi:hypothetical protein